MRKKWSYQQDAGRKTFRITFPDDPKPEQIIACVESITGSLKPPRGSLLAPLNIAFETWSTQEGFTHRMRIPWHIADDVQAQLYALIPGIRIKDETGRPEHDWTVAFEYREKDKSRTLRLKEPQVEATKLLASMRGGLREGEAILIQWVITAAPDEAMPTDAGSVQSTRVLRSLLTGFANKDEVNDRRAKLETQNVNAVLRVAAKAETVPRALFLANRIDHRFASMRSAHNAITRRTVDKHRLLRSIAAAQSPPYKWPIKLTAKEFVSVMAWKIGQPHVAGISTAASRQLAATAATPSVGRILADGNFPGETRPLALSMEASTMHTYLLGATGTGKSTIFENLIAQDIQESRGVILIQQDGTLYQNVMNLVTRERLDDVVAVDVNDPLFPVGFNILGQGNPQVVANNLKRLFTHIFGKSGLRFSENLYHGIVTLMTSKAATEPMTFPDLLPLLVPQTPTQGDYREAMSRGVEHDEMLNAYWQRIGNKSQRNADEFMEPVLDRLWELCARPEVANIIGQSRRSLNLYDAIKQKKLILVNLSGLGDDTAAILGSLLLQAMWDAFTRGAGDADNPTMMYLDEFQSFTNLPISFADFLAQARKYGLAVNLAHQDLSQLSTPMVSSVMTNARTKIILQTSVMDARILAREFGPMVTETDFTQLKKFEAIMRVLGEEGVSAPMTGVTRPAPRKTGLGEQARTASRRQWSTPLADVEREIRERREKVANSLNGSKRKNTPTNFGGTEWPGGKR